MIVIVNAVTSHNIKSGNYNKQQYAARGVLLNTMTDATQ